MLRAKLKTLLNANELPLRLRRQRWLIETFVTPVARRRQRGARDSEPIVTAARAVRADACTGATCHDADDARPV